MQTRLIKSVAAVAVSLIVSASAHAVSFGFTKITSNSSSDVSGQLWMDVTDAGSGKVAFTFTNNVGLASSITDIYFQAVGLGSISSITDSGAGVAFTAPASPGELPGGSAVSFDTTGDLSADSDSPVSANGINAAGEWVTITLNLGSYANYAAIIDALNNPVDGSIRVGMHVQAHPDGNSDGYVNVPNTSSVPDSGTTAILLGLGLVLVSFFVRRQQMLA